MMTELTHLPAAASTDENLNVIAKDGAVILDEVLSADEVAFVQAEIMPYVNATRPGQTKQPIHRDRWAWGTFLQGIEPQFNTIWAVTDFTEKNGAPRAAPGSIDWPDNRQPNDDEIAFAEMKRGSVILYTGSVFHGGGANGSKPEHDTQLGSADLYEKVVADTARAR